MGHHRSSYRRDSNQLTVIGGANEPTPLTLSNGHLELLDQALHRPMLHF